jgi:hypothetical protein
MQRRLFDGAQAELGLLPVEGLEIPEGPIGVGYLPAAGRTTLAGNVGLVFYVHPLATSPLAVSGHATLTAGAFAYDGEPTIEVIEDRRSGRLFTGYDGQTKIVFRVRARARAYGFVHSVEPFIDYEQPEPEHGAAVIQGASARIAGSSHFDHKVDHVVSAPVRVRIQSHLLDVAYDGVAGVWEFSPFIRVRRPDVLGVQNPSDDTLLLLMATMLLK